MIRFEQFINSIQGAVQSANSALMQENLKLLEVYFEDSEETQEIKTSLDNALEAMEGIVHGKKQSQEATAKAMQALSVARDALQNEHKKGIEKQSSSLKAKTIALQFADQTSEGVVMRQVHVPLITLTPISMAQVAEVKFRSNLELQVIDNELHVGFTPATTTVEASNGSDSNSANSSYIEITLRPQESSGGLKKLISGYESMLRSQMPN